MQSVVTWEKPITHLSLSDWDARLYDLTVIADTRRADAFDLRHNSRQLRNETNVKTQWDSLYNRSKLSDRIFEIGQCKKRLQGILEHVDREITALRVERASTETELETLNAPLLLTSQCLSQRDARRGPELTYDLADIELKKELSVMENNRKLLIDRCQSAWEKLNKLEVVKFKVQLNINDKVESLNIDSEMLAMTTEHANISYKPHALRIPEGMLSNEKWIAESESLIKMVEAELRDTLRLRESLFIARGRARNNLRAQTDATNYMMRRRVFETQRSKNELEWQKSKMEENMDKLSAELVTLTQSQKNKINSLKLAETRLENRSYRPGLELTADDPHKGLIEEANNLRYTINQLEDRIKMAKATYNALESTSIRVKEDLSDKTEGLETDMRALEMRAALQPKEPQGTDKNLVLASVDKVIPPT